MRRVITNKEVLNTVDSIVFQLPIFQERSTLKFFGVPRGGVPVAYALAGKLKGSIVVDNPADADYVVDDIMDSGKTRAKYPSKKFISLYASKRWINGTSVFFNTTIFGEITPDWLVFPWEKNEDASAEDIGVRLLQYIGEDPTREGLVETPKRFLKAWREWTSGYRMNPSDVFKSFEDGAEGYDQMVIIDPIPFDSFCEHHLAIIQGTVHLAYIPNGRIAGLSKFCRLVEVYARRLQVQERMTTQIASAIQNELKPLGCGVVVRAQHTCMSSRGAKVFGATTTTTSLQGEFKDDSAVRQEFLSMIKGRN